MRLLLLILFMSIVAGCGSGGDVPPPQVMAEPWTPRAHPQNQVNFIAMGDWGANSPEQAKLAETMGGYVESRRVQFNGALLLGDNFYTPLRGTRDRYWRSLFEEMYDPRRLNMPFYAALGNHDYEGRKAQIQLDYAKENPDSRWKMPALWYRLDLPADNPLVTILMLNSNKLSLTADQWQRQLRWLEEELARPRTSRWLIACAHHPFFSNGMHGDNPALQTEWGTLFRRHGVDFYLSGHDHSLQHLEMAGWPMSFIVSGAGGRVLYPHTQSRGPFARSVNGFVHIQFFSDRAIVRVIHGPDGRLLHAFERDRQGRVIVRATTGIDRVVRVLKPLEMDPFEELPPDMPIPATVPATIPATRPASAPSGDEMRHLTPAR